MIYRGPKKNAHGKCLFAECQKKALGKDAFCRVPKNGTWQNTSLSGARKKALGKDAFCRVPKMALGKIHLCRVLKKHSAKPSLPSAEKNTRQSRLCRVPNKIHSAKLPALGKVPASDSVSNENYV